MIYPVPLSPGDRVALVGPSGPVPPERFQPALDAGKALGLSPVPYPSASASFGYLAGDDPRQQLLRYQILKQKQAPLAQLISSLENYTSEELDEKWLYELAELYHKAGDSARCVAACDKIMLMFGLGKYVDKAGLSGRFQK